MGIAGSKERWAGGISWQQGEVGRQEYKHRVIGCRELLYSLIERGKNREGVLFC